MTPKAFMAAAVSIACLAGAGARAEEVPVCFNYGCQDRAAVRLDPAQLKHVGGLFAQVASPEAEREAIAAAMAWLYAYAGEQTPTWLDRGGNIDDDGIPGRMDCIDHSTNTTALLAMLERRGWVRFHAVTEPVQRGWLLTVHWTAQVIEKPTGARWVVDTWFLDPGYPAAVFPLEAWLDGARPRGAERFRLR